MCQEKSIFTQISGALEEYKASEIKKYLANRAITTINHHPGHVVMGMILDMMKACIDRTGKEAVGLKITGEMAELLWDYMKLERGDPFKDRTRQEWLNAPELLALPTKIGSDFVVYGVDDAPKEGTAK